MVTKTSRGFSIRIFASENALAHALADRICALTEERASAGRSLVLGLAAGASPRGVYRELAMRVRAGQLDLSSSAAFCLDEYYPIDPADPRSYAKQLSSIAAELRISGKRFRIPSGSIPRQQIARLCKQYEDDIRTAGGIDLQILGLGRSGHIGFNEPGASQMSRTRLVPLSERTRQDAAPAFGGLDFVPREAITMGVGSILECREIALIAMGDIKAAIVRQLVEDPPSSVVPASYLQGHACATVYLDALAARLLAGST